MSLEAIRPGDLVRVDHGIVERMGLHSIWFWQVGGQGLEACFEAHPGEVLLVISVKDAHDTFNHAVSVLHPLSGRVGWVHLNWVMQDRTECGLVRVG